MDFIRKYKKFDEFKDTYPNLAITNDQFSQSELRKCL